MDQVNTPTSRLSFLRPEAEPGFLTCDVISKFDRIKGFFNEDDCMHFFLILEMQSLNGVTGDILEIGSYFGRSTALLAYCLRPGETLCACDAFEEKTGDQYAATPSIYDLQDSIRLVNPKFDFTQLEVHSGLSTELELATGPRFRFAHIDGGHDAETAYHDICLAAARLLPQGIIAIDDYKHANWPEVTTAVDRFLAENEDTYRVLADMNRHVAKGRKIYLAANCLTSEQTTDRTID